MRGRELEAVRAGEEGGLGVPGCDGAEAGGVRGWRRRHRVRAVGAATLRCLLDIQLVGFRRPGRRRAERRRREIRREGGRAQVTPC